MEAFILNDTDLNVELRQTLQTTWYGIVLISLSFLGVIGNSIVCYIIGRTKKLHNPTNYLIANLAVADLLVCITSTFKPIVDLGQFTKSSWPATYIETILFCKFLDSGFSLWITSTASALGLILVSFERFIGIVYPLHYRRLVTKTRLRIAIFCQWTLAFLGEMPWVSKVFYDEEAQRCQSRYSPQIALLYAFAGYVLPIIALV